MPVVFPDVLFGIANHAERKQIAEYAVLTKPLQDLEANIKMHKEYLGALQRHLAEKRKVLKAGGTMATKLKKRLKSRAKTMAGKAGGQGFLSSKGRKGNQP